MSAGRVAFAAAMVAAAWTTAITGIAVVGAGKAEAAWLKSGNGTAAAKAAVLAAPASFTVTAVKCNGSNRQVSMSWAAVTGALTYELYATDSGGANGRVLTTTGSTTVAAFDLPYKPALITVRPLDNRWRGAASDPATGCP